MTGTDEHGLKMQQTAVKEGIDVTRTRGAQLRRVPGHGQGPEHLVRPVHPHHGRRPPERQQGDLGRGWPTSGDIYLDTYSGWYSVRDEAFYTEAETTLLEDGTRQSTETGTPVEWTEESNVLLPSVGVPGQSARAVRGAPRIHRPRDAPQRDRQLRQGRPQGPVDLAHHVRLGRPVPGDPGARHVRLGRRAHQLPHRRRIPGHRLARRSGSSGPPTCTSSARTSRGSTPCTGRRS